MFRHAAMFLVTNIVADASAQGRDVGARTNPPGLKPWPFAVFSILRLGSAPGHVFRLLL